MTVITVGLVECFFQFQAAAFQFNLYQRQAVDQQGHVIAISIGPLHGDLMGHLVFVLAPLDLVNQFDVAGIAVIFGVIDLVAEYFGFPEDIAAGKFVQYLFELPPPTNWSCCAFPAAFAG